MKILAAISVGLLISACIGCGKAPVADYVRQLGNADVKVRRAAAKALDQPGENARLAVDALSQAVTDTDRDVRRLACHALGQIGPDAKPAVPQLNVALRDPDISVRLVAAFALQKIDPAGQAYVPVLTQTMLTGEGGVIVSVGNMGAAADWAVPTLVELLQGKRPGIRRLAAEALGKIGPAARAAEPSLRQALGDHDARARQAAADALRAVASGTAR